jgi:outer membrane protein assembly factor BamB
VAGCGGGAPAADWAAPNGDLGSTRAARGSAIDAGNVARLAPAWRFRLRGAPGLSGIVASNPLVVGDRVLVQDLSSNVWSIRRDDGTLAWVHRYARPTTGPNGIAVADGRVYGNTDTSAFALELARGRELWHRRLTTPLEQAITVAPLATRGLVVTSTVGLVPGGRGALYGLAAATGRVRWRFGTIRDPWPVPAKAAGGGLWYPPSADGSGTLYAGTANPYPWGGTKALPNGAAFGGAALYTDSLIVLDPRGRLLWHDQVTPHDVRDYDFQLPPVLTGKLAIGGGKAGRVVAWDTRTRQRLWETPVGLHRNDRGPLPRKPVTVCPGLLGGVETPMAVADGRVFVPVVDLCMRGWATGYQSLYRVDVEAGRGRVVALDAATGALLWERRLGSPVFGCATVANDVVFTATYDGRVLALAASDGRELWSARLRAGINACPAVAGDLLVVAAGVDTLERLPHPVPELVAFRLRR